MVYKDPVYNDPGHGWVKVPILRLITLGIHDKITTYSYMRNGYAYLEEDLDMWTYINALNAKGHTVDFKHFHTDNESRIRNYDRYSVDKINTALDKA